MRRIIFGIAISAACLLGSVGESNAGGIRIVCLPNTPCPPPVGTDPVTPNGLFPSPIQPDIGAGVGGPDATFVAGPINFFTPRTDGGFNNQLGAFLPAVQLPDTITGKTVNDTWFAFYGTTTFSGPAFIKIIF